MNLALADLRKEGSGFDLPMAMGVLGCQGQFFGRMLDQMMFLGELLLDSRQTRECHVPPPLLTRSAPARQPSSVLFPAPLSRPTARRVPPLRSRPGELSLGHNGVLFLEELPEFPGNVLEVMRPLQTQKAVEGSAGRDLSCRRGPP